MKKLLKRFIPDTHPLRLWFHRSKAMLAALRYGFPARKLTVIGVTGTDGKTTTVGMIAHILSENGRKSGALSTAFFRVDKDIQWNATQKTSPSPFVVQQFLRSAVKAGCTHAVLEYSSHGLLQGRLNFTWPLVAAITNLAEEHLDYHGTMEEYARAKSLLFRMLRRGGVKVLNADDRTYHLFLEIPSTWTIEYSSLHSFGDPKDAHQCAYWLTDKKVTPSSSSALLHCNAEPGIQNLELSIPGEFNLENALAAIGACHGAGLIAQECTDALKTFHGVPGRIERIDAGQNFSVYVDFTVTPQSYEKTLTTIRRTLKPGSRLLVLTGSCGDRMKEKRPMIGKLCSELADTVIVTNEDPYTEDPEKIIDEVLAGVQGMPIYRSTTEVHSNQLNKFCVRLSDRMEAVQFILRQAKEGDAILLAGKGSDTTMMTAKGQVPWNEREIVRKELKKLTKVHKEE